MGNISFIGECAAFQPLSASRNLEASLLLKLDSISVSFNLGCLYFCQYSSFKNGVCVVCVVCGVCGVFVSSKFYLLKAIPTIYFQTCLSF